MAVLSPVLMERIPFHGSTDIFCSSLCKGCLSAFIGLQVLFSWGVYFYGGFVIYQESLAG
jgi:hypothetical protein